MGNDKQLERLILSNGSFVDGKGNTVDVEILEICLTNPHEGSPFFQSQEIPKGADAFAEGKTFNYNSGGSWGAFPQYCAPTVYLHKKKK